MLFLLLRKKGNKKYQKIAGVIDHKELLQNKFIKTISIPLPI